MRRRQKNSMNRNFLAWLATLTLTTSCATIEDARPRLESGVYVSQSGDFQISNPIPPDQCLELFEAPQSKPGADGSGFVGCGRRTEYYFVTQRSVPGPMSTNEFHQYIEEQVLPEYLQTYFLPTGFARMFDEFRGLVHGRPGYRIDFARPSDDWFRVRSTFVLHCERMFIFSVQYSMTARHEWGQGSDEMFRNYGRFVGSFQPADCAGRATDQHG